MCRLSAHLYYSKFFITSYAVFKQSTVAEFKKSNGIDLKADKMAMQRLKEAAEKAKKEANTEVIKNYSSGKLEDRRPILNRLVNEALSFKFSPDMLDKEYIEHNFVDMQRKMTLLGELEGLLKVDEINKKYYDGLPQSVKSRLDFLADFHATNLERADEFIVPAENPNFS